jgi:preprotein translocase subunit SecD
VTFQPGVFVEKVGNPFVGQQVAIVVDGEVRAAPFINTGIAGDEVTITGDFTQDEAVAVSTAINSL